MVGQSFNGSTVGMEGTSQPRPCRGASCPSAQSAQSPSMAWGTAEPLLTRMCFNGIPARRGDRSSWTARPDSDRHRPPWRRTPKAPVRCVAVGRQRDPAGRCRWIPTAREPDGRRRPLRSGAALPPHPIHCPRSRPCPAAPSAPSARRRSSPRRPASPTSMPAPNVTARSATSAASTPTRISLR